jgi:glycosyltransferase involved in cell wall biosynthesis
VLAQETGFSDFIPAGEGLFAFESTEDVLAAIEELRANYTRHARAARAIAEELFNSDKILSRLLDRLFSTSAGTWNVRN